MSEPDELLGGDVGATWIADNLRNPATAVAALQQFTTSLRKSEPSDAAALLRSYENRDAGCSAVFDVWADRRAHHEGLDEFVLHEVFGAMLEVSEHNDQLEKVAVTLSRKIIQGEMKSIYRCLGAKIHRHIKAALRLLSAIVNVNSTMAAELYAAFDFTLKALWRLPIMDGGAFNYSLDCTLCTSTCSLFLLL